MDSLYKQEDCKTCNTEKSPVKGRPDLVWINATKSQGFAELKKDKACQDL